MNMKRIVLAAIPIVAAVWVLASNERRNRDQIEQLRAKVESLSAGRQAERERFNDAMGALARGAATRPIVASAAAATSAVDATGAAKGEAAGAAVKAPPITFEESQQHVLAAYAEEAVDAKWSAEAVRTLEAAVRSHMPARSRLKSIECRATMCRLEVVHGRVEDENPFIMDGFAKWPGSIMLAGESRDGEGIAVTLIASREGTQPPIGAP
jgi:hypothetical protein